MQPVTAQMMATMTNVRGDIRKVDGKTVGVLTFDSASGSNHELSISDFDNIYKSFVNCWPVVKPLKEQMVTAQREEGKAGREAEKVAAKEKKVADRAKAKAELATQRDAEKAQKAADRAQKKAEEAIAKANIAKAKADEDTKALDIKKNEDAARLKAAADRLANTGTAKLPRTKK